MKIMALRRAFYNGSIIKTGEILDIKGNSVPSWAKKINEDKNTQKENSNKKQEENSAVVNANPDADSSADGANINVNIGNENVQLNINVKDSQEGKESVEDNTTAEEISADDLEGKTEEELLDILNKLIDETVAKGITLENAENKTVKEQIKELRELVK